MILMVGILEDPVICYLMNYCVDMEVDFAFVNLNQLGYDIFFDQEYWYFPGCPPFSHQVVTGVFNRALFSWEYASILQQKLFVQLFDWMDFRYPNVLNRPQDTFSNLSKPLQLRWASYFDHWVVPYTWILSQSEVRINTPSIIKSVSSARSVVNDQYHQEHVDLYEPVQVQPVLDGLNIRLHLCGEKGFATSIQSDSLDYRYHRDSNTFEDYHDLPEGFMMQSIEFCKKIGLLFCGIDLILHKNKYYFLEANPSPGYTYFEKNLPHFCISSSLVDYLKGQP